MDIRFGEWCAGDDGETWARREAGSLADEGDCCVVLGEEFGDDVLACSSGGAQEEEMHGFCALIWIDLLD